MTLADLDAVMKIEKVSFPTPWHRSYFVQEIQRNPVSYPFAMKSTGSKQEVIGFCVCWIRNNELHVQNIAIDPKYRRQGCGKILMQVMLAFGGLQKCRQAILEVRVSNLEARRLYESLGFQSAGRIPDYYEDTHEDALVLARPLTGEFCYNHS